MRANRTAVATNTPGTVANPERFARNTLAIAVSGALLSGVAVAQNNDIELETLRVEEEVTPDTNPYAEAGRALLGQAQRRPPAYAAAGGNAPDHHRADRYPD